MNIPIWDAYAIRYAKVKRRRIENFISHDLHDVATQMDYFVWFLKNDQETILVDTGFNEAAAQLRNREYLRCPIESLKNTGVQLEDLKENKTSAKTVTTKIPASIQKYYTELLKLENMQGIQMRMPFNLEIH
jgi:hypothetical protein